MVGISHTVYEQVWKLPAAMRIPVSFCICSLGWFTPRSTAGFRGTISGGVSAYPMAACYGGLGIGIGMTPWSRRRSVSRSQSCGLDPDCDRARDRRGDARSGWDSVAQQVGLDRERGGCSARSEACTVSSTL